MALKFDVKKEFSFLYAPKNQESTLIDIPSMRYLSISGEGAPESSGFSEAIRSSLFEGISRQIHFSGRDR